MPISVIVVDDEKFDRINVSRRLAKYPHFRPVIEVDDGDTFLDRFYAPGGVETVEATPEAPALVLMDINMRRMGGFEAVAEMQNRIGQGIGQPHVAVVMLSSSANERDRARAEILPLVHAYLTKPLSPDRVDRILELYVQSGFAA